MGGLYFARLSPDTRHLVSAGRHPPSTTCHWWESAAELASCFEKWSRTNDIIDLGIVQYSFRSVFRDKAFRFFSGSPRVVQPISTDCSPTTTAERILRFLIAEIQHRELERHHEAPSIEVRVYCSFIFTVPTASSRQTTTDTVFILGSYRKCSSFTNRG